MQHKRPKTPAPRKRKNPSGKTVWVARYPTKDGLYKSGGTFARKWDAQEAIVAAMNREWSATLLQAQDVTIGEYFATWLERHPRSPRTNRTNQSRISQRLDVEIDGVKLRDWPFAELRKKHAKDLMIHLLEEGHAAQGANNILSVFSAMATDAIDDDVTETNPFLRVRVRANDSRVKKPPRPIRVWSWEQMREFANNAHRRRYDDGAPTVAPAPEYRALLRAIVSLVPRINEIFGIPQELVDRENGLIKIRWSVDPYDGSILDGVKTTHDKPLSQRELGRSTPLGPTLAQMIWEMPWPTQKVRFPDDVERALLFATPSGRPWILNNFYRDVWIPTQEATGMDMRPHEARHSAETHLLAAGVDPADMALMAGHTVATMNARYRHPTQASFDRVRELVG